MNYALSGADILTLLKNKVKIIRYRDVSNYATISDLLKPYNKVFILYENHDNKGHWTLLHKLNRNNIELFDSYGLFPDEELEYISSTYRKDSNQLRAHLSKLLADSKCTIHFNDKQLQRLESGINTCGRWCISRAINNHISIDEFCRRIFVNSDKRKIDPDQLVCELVRI